MRLAITGANGRMGRAIVRLAVEAGDVTIACAIGASDVGKDAGELAGVGPIGVAITKDIAALEGARADVVIDFSAAPVVAEIANAASRAGVAIVSGTTGLGDDALAALDRASAKVAVLWEPNMSTGVHVLADLVRRAVAALGDSFDIEIVEAHHRAKVDAPSGTAKRLAEVAASAASAGQTSRFVHGREGRPGPRAKTEIGIHAVRGGDVIGDHAVHLLGAGERIEIVHRATSRDVFAHGALRAARWLAGKPAKRYTLDDTLT